MLSNLSNVGDSCLILSMKFLMNCCITQMTSLLVCKDETSYISKGHWTMHLNLLKCFFWVNLWGHPNFIVSQQGSLSILLNLRVCCHHHLYALFVNFKPYSRNIISYDGLLRIMLLDFMVSCIDYGWDVWFVWFIWYWNSWP